MSIIFQQNFGGMNDLKWFGIVIEVKTKYPEIQFTVTLLLFLHIFASTIFDELSAET